MADTQALAALLARVENGTGPIDRALFGDVFIAFGLNARWREDNGEAENADAILFERLYEWAENAADLTASNALLERAMPHCIAGFRMHHREEGKGWFAWINSQDYWVQFEEGSTRKQTGSRVTADAATPARALLAALIKAKMEYSAQ